MQKDNLRAAMTIVEREANTLKSLDSPMAARLTRLAQMMQHGDTAPDNVTDGSLSSPLAQASMYDFDPSREQSLAPTQDASTMDMAKKEKNLHPGISSFVREPEGHEMIGEPNYKVHVAQVTFKAPLDMNEGDIMNFILGIKEALNVEVEGFQWNVRPSKKSEAK